MLTFVIADNPAPAPLSPVEVCLSWFSPNEYQKLREAAGGHRLLPYESWLEIFGAAKAHFMQEPMGVLVVTVVTDELLAFANKAGLQMGPDLCATYAIAAASGSIQAPVERFRAH